MRISETISKIETVDAAEASDIKSAYASADTMKHDKYNKPEPVSAADTPCAAKPDSSSAGAINSADTPDQGDKAVPSAEFSQLMIKIHSTMSMTGMTEDEKAEFRLNYDIVMNEADILAHQLILDFCIRNNSAPSDNTVSLMRQYADDQQKMLRLTTEERMRLTTILSRNLCQELNTVVLPDSDVLLKKIAQKLQYSLSHSAPGQTTGKDDPAPDSGLPYIPAFPLYYLGMSMDISMYLMMLDGRLEYSEDIAADDAALDRAFALYGKTTEDLGELFLQYGIQPHTADEPVHKAEFTAAEMEAINEVADPVISLMLAKILSEPDSMPEIAQESQ